MGSEAAMRAFSCGVDFRASVNVECWSASNSSTAGSIVVRGCLLCGTDRRVHFAVIIVAVSWKIIVTKPKRSEVSTPLHLWLGRSGSSAGPVCPGFVARRGRGDARRYASECSRGCSIVLGIASCWNKINDKGNGDAPANANSTTISTSFEVNPRDEP